MAGGSFLGVDGGGSRTTAVLFDGNGGLLAREVGDSINFNSLGYARARDSMSKILDGVSRACGISCFDGAFIGMSALNSPATDEELFRFADGVVPAAHIGMDSDLAVAMESMLTDGACAVVISGTGSMAVSRSADGVIRHAGGWGHLLGDEGSGFCVATEGLRAAVRAHEGSAPPTLLTDSMRSFYRLNELEDAIDIFYNPPKERKDVAAFAAEVTRLADEGDDEAVRIVVSQAELLAGTAGTLLSSLPGGSPIGLWGGIFQNCRSFTAAFKNDISRFGNFDAKLLDFPPEIGAVFAAYRICGVPLTDEMLRNIKLTYQKGEKPHDIYLS